MGTQSTTPVNEAYRSVEEFHLRNEQITSSLPRLVGPNHTLLRVRLHLEELGELSICVHESNLVGIADGLTDLFYVVVGTAVTCGIPVIDAWKEIPTGEMIEIELKWRVALLANLSRKIGSLNYWLTTTNLEQVELRLNDVIEVIHACAIAMRVPLKECFREVHRANMSKTLGRATDGKKYGDGGGKGANYKPPELQPLLFKLFAEKEGR